MDMNTSSENQETSISEATPAQEATTEQASDTAQSTPEVDTTIPENWEYDGNRNAVPKPFQNYVKGIDRYWSKKSQTLAELGQKVKEWDEFKSSEDYKAFQQFRESKQTNTGSQPSERKPLVTQDEMDAIALGDVKTLEEVIQRGIEMGLETKVTPKLEEINKERQAALMERKERDAAVKIDSFTKANPDFQELLQSPVGEFMIDAAKRGMGLEEIYQSAKQAEKFFLERTDAKRKADFEAKKKGSVVGKTISGTPDVVYADNEDMAKRLAVELELRGDKRQVHIKRK